VIEAQPAFEISERALAKHFDTLAARESLGFDHIQGDALQTLFPDCHVRILTDRDHFVQYYRFLNPAVGASVSESVLEVFDPALSIQENCLFGDIVQPPNTGVSFQLDAYNHAILAMRLLPKRMGPNLISNLTELGFQDYELTLNIYPLATAQVVKKLEDTANFQAIEARDTPKKAWRLGTQVKMAAERIEELERGQVLPVDVFLRYDCGHKVPRL
jgi:type IV secretion system protein TrbE